METVLWSNAAGERDGTPLLVMLHGYGSDETRMAAHFAAMPNGFTCASLRAPHGLQGGHGWFLLDYFLNNDFAEVLASAGSVLAWIDTVRARHALRSVALLGFSQGMAMASAVLRLRPEVFTAVVGLSGFVLDNALLAAMEPLERRLPFYWGRDTADLVINPDATAFTAGWLPADTELAAATYRGLGHAMRADELADAASFLTLSVPGSFRPSAS